jgi:hypothetical protein
MLPVDPGALGAICRTYAEMVDAINARLVELNVQHLALDERCGLASGHTGLLLPHDRIELVDARSA